MFDATYNSLHYFFTQYRLYYISSVQAIHTIDSKYTLLNTKRAFLITQVHPKHNSTTIDLINYTRKIFALLCILQYYPTANLCCATDLICCITHLLHKNYNLYKQTSDDESQMQHMSMKDNLVSVNFSHMQLIGSIKYSKTANYYYNVLFLDLID